jgi:putative transposase
MYQYFGEITSGQMIFTETGLMVTKCIMEIPQHFPHVFLDEFIVMPNHVHMILFMDQNRLPVFGVECNRVSPCIVETQNFASLQRGEFILYICPKAIRENIKIHETGQDHPLDYFCCIDPQRRPAFVPF